MASLFLIGMPSGMELFVIGMILIFLFGASRLPKLARGIGSSITEFKKGLKDGRDEDDEGELPPGEEKKQLPKDD